MQTRYVGSAALGRMVRQRGVAEFLRGLAGYIRADYLRWEAFEKTPRLASHTPIGVIELMPATDGRLYAFKYVNGHPGNAALGLPTVMAFGVLADVATGYPLLLSEMTLLTALRTAATSALAASAMARSASRTMALIGNGAQSEFQALAFHAMLGVDQIRAYDVDARATHRLIANLTGVAGLRVLPAASVDDAVRGADIITTATADKRRAAVLVKQQVPAGAHINAIGGDCPGKTELDPGILRDARIVVEFEPQTRVEGEIQQLAPDVPVAALSDVLAQRTPGRGPDAEITVFDSVGFALEDYSALRYIADLDRVAPESQALDLVPELRDPRNLYAALAGPDVGK